MTTLAMSGRAVVIPGRALAAAVLVGLAADRVTTHGPATVSGAIMIAIAGIGLTGDGVTVLPRADRISVRLLGLVVTMLGASLMIRTAPSVAAPNLLAAFGALLLMVVLRRGASLFDLTVPRLAVQSCSAIVDTLRLPLAISAWCSGVRDRLVSHPRHRQLISAYTRGVVLALGVALLVVPLLAAGDAVFASLVDVNLTVGPLAGHTFIVALVTAAFGALLFAAARPASEPSLPRGPVVGTPELAVTLGTLVVVYSAFAVSQIVAAVGGADRVLDTAGLTYAEYARTGFFQLLAAAAVTLGVLLTLAGLARHGATPRWVHAMSVTVVALTLVCVVIAVQRLFLYEDAFGLTILRLYALVGAGWVAVILCLAAVATLGVGRDRRWLPGAMITSVLALLLLMTAINPEAVVVRRNIARAESGDTLDTAYLGGLSDDALPALAEALPRLAERDRQDVVRLMCLDTSNTYDRPAIGWSWNLSKSRAQSSLRELC